MQCPKSEHDLGPLVKVFNVDTLYSHTDIFIYLSIFKLYRTVEFHSHISCFKIIQELYEPQKEAFLNTCIFLDSYDQKHQQNQNHMFNLDSRLHFRRSNLCIWDMQHLQFNCSTASTILLTTCANVIDSPYRTASLWYTFPFSYSKKKPLNQI